MKRDNTLTSTVWITLMVAMAMVALPGLAFAGIRPLGPNPPTPIRSYGFVRKGYIDVVPLYYLVSEPARMAVLNLRLHTLSPAEVSELVQLSNSYPDDLALWVAAIQADDALRKQETDRLLPADVHGMQEQFKRATLQWYDFELHEMTDPNWYVNKLKRATDATVPPTTTLYSLWLKTRNITIGLMALAANSMNGSAKGFDAETILRGVAPKSVISEYEAARLKDWNGAIPSWRDCSDDRMRAVYAALITIADHSHYYWQKCELVNGSWTPTGPHLFNKQTVKEGKYIERWIDNIDSSRTIKTVDNDFRHYGFTHKK